MINMCTPVVHLLGHDTV